MDVELVFGGTIFPGRFSPDGSFTVGISACPNWNEGEMDVEMRILGDAFDIEVTRISVDQITRRNVYFTVISIAEDNSEISSDADESETDCSEDDPTESLLDSEQYGELLLQDFSDDEPE